MRHRPRDASKRDPVKVLVSSAIKKVLRMARDRDRNRPKRLVNRDQFLLRRRKLREASSEPAPIDPVKALVARAIGHVKTKAKNRAREAARHHDNPDKMRDAAAAARTAHPETFREYRRDDYSKHRQQRIQKAVAWNAAPDNHQKRRRTVNAWTSKERRTNTAFSISERLRGRLRSVLDGRRKATTTSKTIGCTKEELVAHLTKQLHGTGNLHDHEIDHIFPATLYDFDDAAAQYRWMHWSNLQPLSRLENRHKADKLPTKAMATKVKPECWPTGIAPEDLPDSY